jgi:shikimate kinase
MGTGKSSVARLAAAQLGFYLVDTDALIESRVGMSISDIFAHQGQAGFREYESQVVEELKRYRKTVISTGGGLGADPEHLASLKEHALVVCLWASAQTIWERVRHQTHRPLLQQPDPQAVIRQLLEERGPVYRQADVLISTELRTVQTATHQALHHFQKARSRPPKA